MPVRPRSGRYADVLTMIPLLASEAINPLAFPPNDFTVLESESESRIVAFGKLSFIDGSTASLSSVLVRPEYREQGFGRRIIAELLSRDGADYRDIWLTTLPSRKGLYAQFGFSEQPAESAPQGKRAEVQIGNPVARAATGESVITMMRQRVRR